LKQGNTINTEKPSSPKEERKKSDESEASTLEEIKQ